MKITESLKYKKKKKNCSNKEGFQINNWFACPVHPDCMLNKEGCLFKIEKKCCVNSGSAFNCYLSVLTL